jgi:hypothetical protein
MVGLSGTLHRRKESVHLPTDKSDVQQHHATAVSWILPASMSQVTICKTAALLRIVYGIMFLPLSPTAQSEGVVRCSTPDAGARATTLSPPHLAPQAIVRTPPSMACSSTPSGTRYLKAGISALVLSY